MEGIYSTWIAAHSWLTLGDVSGGLGGGDECLVFYVCAVILLHNEIKSCWIMIIFKNVKMF